MNKKHLIYIVLAFCFIYCVFLNSSVKAYVEEQSEGKFSIPDELLAKAKTLPEYSETDPEYLMLVATEYWINYHCVFFIPTNINVWKMQDNSGWFEIKFSSMEGLIFYRFEFGSLNQVLRTEDYSTVVSSGLADFRKNSGEYQMWSEVSVYKDSTLQETFFQRARLRPIIQAEMGGMKMTLQEVIQLLPMILVVVASCLGLRKALQMLSMVLRRS